MAQRDDCIFCKISAGTAPAVKIFEDEHTLAFMDIFPASKGHSLVISKAHYENLLEITPALLSAVALASQRLAQAIHSALEPDGMRVTQFNGAAAGQTVFHYHVHVRPIYQGQDARSHGHSQADPKELETIAAQIRAALH